MPADGFVSGLRHIFDDNVSLFYIQVLLPTFLLRKAGEVKGEKPLSPFANGEISCRRSQAAKFYFTIFTRNDGSAVSSSERADEPNKRISSPLSISLMGTGCVFAPVFVVIKLTCRVLASNVKRTRNSKLKGYTSRVSGESCGTSVRASWECSSQSNSRNSTKPCLASV